MADSSPNPPSTLFGALSLGSHQASHEESQQSAQNRPSPRTFNLSFSSSSSSGSDASSSPGGAFVFGRQSPQPASPPTPSPATKQSTSPGIVFRFGSTDQDAASSDREAQPQTFSFRALHNVTPLPSPSPSRETSPQPPASRLQSPFTFVSTPPARATRSTSTSNHQVPEPELLSPSSPPSAIRHRSLSIASSTPSTPSQTQPETPETPQATASTPQPITPITPYDARDEPAPRHALFTSVFQDALEQGPEIAKKAAVAIEKMSAGGLEGTDSEIEKFLNDTRDLQRFQGTDARTIAVLGDSGEGKSSLINSLLHYPGVAQTGDIGSACTNIVTEYRQKRAEHSAPITIEVEYLSTYEIEEIVREMLWSYRQLFLPGIESNDTSDQDYARYSRESEQAWSALHAAFKHKRQFTQKFAQDTSEGALERVTRQLIEWTTEIEWPSSGIDGFWTSTAETAEECVEHTKLFMQDKYWPFTKIIRVYLNSQVLKTGVVLADLPGLQDTNLARVRATQDYLIKCDNIIIVAKISRAITDQSLKSSLFFALSRHVPTEWEHSGAQKFKVAVVCTRSEDINQANARSEFCGRNKRISPEAMAQLDEEINAAKSVGDRTRKKVAKRKQELLLIQARANHVKENLQNVYSSEMEGKRLDVFCVSNKWYEKYCPKGNNEFVEASGIPELRRFCHTLTAEAQLNEAKHFLKSKLSTVLNSLDLWASSLLNKQDDSEMLNDSVYNELNAVEDGLNRLIKNFLQEFSACFQEQIMTFFARRDQHWEEAASKEGQKWTEWHWSKLKPIPHHTEDATNDYVVAQYNAWCRNNGNHQTMRRGQENWNAKIIWKMRMELEGQWDLVEEEVSDDFLAMLRGAKSLLETWNATLPRQYAVYRSAVDQKGHIEEGVLFPQLSIAIAESMNKAIAAAGKKVDDLFEDVVGSIKKDVDTIFRSHPRLQTRPTLRNEQRESKIRDFADEIKHLKQKHERLLQSIESL
ncbi:hypothetical protein FALBO_253 [Fusarium albosuccineum]|uniref:G domain-containing protein n=1 Tax=Fusarium albosuccineum TaxID=1237068 RepID=A0A8H4LQ06_9HYPO|nr:hypothetical protein FALBO_253 [Fusarium albosuccineum]